MKSFINEYAKIFAGLITVLIIGVSFYNIINNINHSNELKNTITVTKSDVYFSDYKSNVEQIKKNIDSYNYENHAYIESKETLDIFMLRLTNAYEVLISDEGLYNVKYNDVVNEVTINELNNYMINTVYNETWIKTLKPFYTSDRELGSFFTERYNSYDTLIYYLINDTTYLKNELKDNSNFYSSSYRSKMNNRYVLQEHFNKLTNIYYSYSNILLEMSEYLANGEIKGDTND